MNFFSEIGKEISKQIFGSKPKRREYNNYSRRSERELTESARHFQKLAKEAYKSFKKK